MTSRRTIGWLLLAVLVLVSGGAAALGVAQAPRQASFHDAVHNTLAASGYTADLTEATPQGQQAEHLVYQAPDRLGGYVESGGQRSYVVVIGGTMYQSVTAPSSAPTDHLVFYRQPSQAPVSALDPVHAYLSTAQQARFVRQVGATTTLTLTRGGQSATFEGTVTGQYVSELQLLASNGHAQLVISDVGSSPSVQLPAGSTVASQGPGLAG